MSDQPREPDLKIHRGNGADHPPVSANIFDDLDSLRLDPNASLAGTIEHLAHVPVRKPGRAEFFRSHPDARMSLACTLFTDDEERENYIVLAQARIALVGQLKPVLLVPCISRQNVAFIWPVPLPTEEGRGSGYRAWGETARQAADLARGCWLRMQADLALGAYRIHKAEGVLPDPVWPQKTLAELLEIAFRDRVIADADHPIIRKLRGLS
jgi:hypothetical protein